MPTSLSQRLRKHRLFLWVVVLPTFLSVLYFGFLASPVYVSESSFVVYSQNERLPSSGLGSLLSGLAGSNSTSAAQTIDAYVRSWDAMMALNRAFNLKKVYGNDSISVFNRFGGVFYPYSSFVRLLKYYRGKVVDELDATTGITTLKVRAFNPKDAQKINAFLLAKSQDIVNQLNQNARQKAVAYAKKDVATAEQRLRSATLALAEYRNRKGVFNPQAQSGLELGMVSRLQDQLIQQQTQLDAIVAHAPNNPQIPVLRSSIATLKAEIQAQSAKVTGSEGSLASKDKEYERLFINQLLATKLLEAAVTSLEQARLTAQKQELYLETISRPNLPDAATEPHRLEGILATFLITLLLWGVLSILVAGIREHHER